MALFIMAHLMRQNRNQLINSMAFYQRIVKGNPARFAETSEKSITF